MLTTGTITSSSLISSSYIVGANSGYTFTINSPTPLIDGDKVLVTMPEDINAALSATYTSC